MSGDSLDDVGPFDVLLPLMHGVGYGLIGANFVNFLEFFDMGLGLAMLCGSIFVVSLFTSLASKIYHEGARGIWPGTHGHPRVSAPRGRLAQAPDDPRLVR